MKETTETAILLNQLIDKYFAFFNDAISQSNENQSKQYLLYMEAMLPALEHEHYGSKTAAAQILIKTARQKMYNFKMNKIYCAVNTSRLV